MLVGVESPGQSKARGYRQTERDADPSGVRGRLEPRAAAD